MVTNFSEHIFFGGGGVQDKYLTLKMNAYFAFPFDSESSHINNCHYMK